MKQGKDKNPAFACHEDIWIMPEDQQKLVQKLTERHYMLEIGKKPEEEIKRRQKLLNQLDNN